MSNLSPTAPLVTCPTCSEKVLWDIRNKHRPFCSERCKLMDLGQWAAERYRVAGETINEEPPSILAGKD